MRAMGRIRTVSGKKKIGRKKTVGRKKRDWAKAAAAGLVFATVGVVGSEGEVDYRKHTMAAVGGHMQAIADIIRGKVPHTDHLVVHADALADLAQIATTLFPTGSEGGDTLPAVWENAEDFQSKLAAFKEATANFQVAAASGEMAQVGGAVQQVGQTCKGCHDDYRKQ